MFFFGDLINNYLGGMLRNIVKGFNLFRFASEVQKSSGSASSSGGITYYNNGELVTRNAITLKKQ